MKISLNSFCFICLLITSSCQLNPKYRRPAVEIPESYRVNLEGNEKDNFNERNEVDLHWWEQFGDDSLNDLIFQALLNNNDLKVAIATVQEYRAIVGSVSSLLFPQIDFNLFKNREQIPLETAPPTPALFRRYNTYSELFSASYELDIWGKIKCESESAYSDYLRQIEVRRTVVLTLISDLASSYIELLKLDKQLEISENTLKSRVESERIARVRFREGLTSELPLKQAESETGSAIIAIKLLEISIPVQENLISVLIGKPSQSIRRDKNLVTLLMPLNLPDEMPCQLLQQRPDILAAEQSLKAANFDIGAARAAFFPDISLTAFFGNQSVKMHHLFKGKALLWSETVNLFQPIFTGGRLLSDLEIAKAIKREAYYSYIQTVLVAFKEVNDSLISYKKNLELVEEQKEQVKIFEQYRHLAKLQYDNGESDYLNFLDAERRLFEAQLLLAETIGNSFTSLINLYKSLGGIWILEADRTALTF